MRCYSSGSAHNPIAPYFGTRKASLPEILPTSMSFYLYVSRLRSPSRAPLSSARLSRLEGTERSKKSLLQCNSVIQ
ncbi:hypothetical protein EYF80_012627 [Liparis tanakae]|uniref:Uncharacterized protein n=1 Tax=Liparis tanakae TaxID=230148 RepID=A0A4Z2IH38_9TELE|nr:hypothetical protein EYF80_012627 [Liparis tanakae]